MHGSMVWGGWAEVVDACMTAWFGVDVQRWDMHAWQPGLGWIGRGGRCMHASIVLEYVGRFGALPGLQQIHRSHTVDMACDCCICY